MKKKYAIIGGSGFIGSALTARLLTECAQVLVVDKIAPKEPKREAEYLVGDFSDKEVLQALGQYKPEAIYFLAGPMGLRKAEGSEEFVSAQKTSENFAKVVTLAAAIGARLVLASSGGALYAQATVIPTPESEAPTPNSAYGKANLELENLLQVNSTNYIILRFSNVYGPGQWKEGVIPSLIHNIREGSAVAINGDGSQTRDFLYIDDAVDALVKAGEKEAAGAFNVSAGRETSMNELIDAVAFEMKKETARTYSGEEGIIRSCLDASKFKETFGWMPRTSLEEGIKKTIG